MPHGGDAGQCRRVAVWACKAGPCCQSLGQQDKDRRCEIPTAFWACRGRQRMPTSRRRSASLPRTITRIATPMIPRRWNASRKPTSPMSCCLIQPSARSLIAARSARMASPPIPLAVVDLAVVAVSTRAISAAMAAAAAVRILPVLPMICLPKSLATAARSAAAAPQVVVAAVSALRCAGPMLPIA